MGIAPSFEAFPDGYKQHIVVVLNNPFLSTFGKEEGFVYLCTRHRQQPAQQLPIQLQRVERRPSTIPKRLRL